MDEGIMVYEESKKQEMPHKFIYGTQNLSSTAFKDA
jgi:hypothetical protein